MVLSVAIRAPTALVWGVLALTSLAACRGEAPASTGDRSGAAGSGAGPERETVAPDADRAVVAALEPLLARAGTPGVLPDADRLALEQAMVSVLASITAACDGCEPAVSYVDEAGLGDYFLCEIREPSGELEATLHIFYRPQLPRQAAASWGRSTLGGHPASALAGEHLFVGPGPFEIRAFARSESLRGAGRLEGWVETLPLDALARL